MSKQANLKKQIAGLQRQLSAMQSGNKPGPSKGSKPSKRQKNRNSVMATPSSSGSITIKRSEMIKSVTTDASGNVGYISLLIHPDSFAFLKNLSKSFEMVRWNSVSIRYVTALGSTEGGLISIGFKPNPEATGYNRVQVMAMTPSLSCVCHSNSRRLVVPKDKLQPVKWFYLKAGAQEDKEPGSFGIVVDSSKKSTTIGELWVDYDVTLSGTTS